MNHKPIRYKIRELVLSINPYDRLEEEHIADISNWINSGVGIFRIKKDAIPPKHLVSYSVVVDPSAGKILLLDHKKAQLMLPSGGHVEVDEMPFEAAIRELQEELDMSLEIVSTSNQNEVPFFATVTQTTGISEKHTDVSLWYVFKGDSTEPIDDQRAEFKSEFSGYQWLDYDGVLSLPIAKLDRHMHRFVGKIKEEG